ncbi:hypothetical protein KJ611_01655 [Patescibacteria group bacterium]|nr:hypothetical protein [Patescibacteria group bacterium]MBU1705417.1 hypothetical protein [Patescibacteria group bacterium]
MKRFVLVTVFLFLLALPAQLLAESSSESYILWGSAVTAGGARATSANYINYISVGDLSSDPMDSANYHGVIGLEALYEEPVMTFSIATTDLSLIPNILSLVSVSTASTSVTVSTNADFGYVVTVTETTAFNNGQGRVLADVTDGEVTAGSEEFGLAVAGDDAAFGDDRGLSAVPLTIASRGIWGADRTTNLTFKAAISSASASGHYSGTYTLIATSNF